MITHRNAVWTIGSAKKVIILREGQDVEALTTWAREQGIGFSMPAELVGNDSVLAEIARGVEEVNKIVSSVEQVNGGRCWTTTSCRRPTS